MVMKTKPLSKKAQMKIQQMSFLLIAVFMFFALVGMIVITVMLSNIKDSVTNLREQNAKLLASRIANSPEFSCGESFGEQKTDCIDLDKVMVLKDNIGKYKNFWGVTNIEIRKDYPLAIVGRQPVTGERECTKDPSATYPSPTYPNCNYIQLLNGANDAGKTGFDTSNFVALCRKQSYRGEVVNKCEIGKIIIRYEEAK